MKQDTEDKNSWTNVEEVVKFPRMPNMLKIRFTDIKMARKATEIGLCIDHYHLSPDQIEMEDFIQLTPCWTCYSYDNNIKACPNKTVKKCPECAGHNKNQPKSLNCDGTHRTLASSCTIRRQKIKEIREQRNNNKKEFEIENRTYCAVTKLEKKFLY